MTPILYVEEYMYPTCISRLECWLFFKDSLEAPGGQEPKVGLEDRARQGEAVPLASRGGTVVLGYPGAPAVQDQRVRIVEAAPDF